MTRWITNYKRYGNVTNSHDLIKFIALIIMVIDHIGHYFFPDELMFRAIGRIGFPVWFFFAGYSSNNKIIEKELVIGCLILVFADFIFGEKILAINALLTITCIRVVNYVLEKKLDLNNPYNFAVINFIFFIFWVPTSLLFEYGTTGIAFGFAGFLTKNYKTSLNKYYLGCLTAWFILEQNFMFELSLIENLVMIIGTCIISYILTEYKIKNYNFKENLSQKTIRFLGRNTLYLYVIHISIFVALKFLIKQY